MQLDIDSSIEFTERTEDVMKDGSSEKSNPRVEDAAGGEAKLRLILCSIAHHRLGHTIDLAIVG